MHLFSSERCINSKLFPLNFSLVSSDSAFSIVFLTKQLSVTVPASRSKHPWKYSHTPWQKRLWYTFEPTQHCSQLLPAGFPEGNSHPLMETQPVTPPTGPCAGVVLRLIALISARITLQCHRCHLAGLLRLSSERTLERRKTGWSQISSSFEIIQV